MKIKIVSLMILAWLSFASNSLPAADSLVDTVAAIVDDEVVTVSDVRSNVGDTEKRLRENYQGDELSFRLKEAKLNVLKALIDRMLIIHEFKRGGGFIPDKEMEERIHEMITYTYSGDANRFEQALADRGETLEDVKKQINDNFIVDYMRKKYVVEKVKARKPANPYDANVLTESTQKAWLDSLRQQAYVKSFF